MNIKGECSQFRNLPCPQCGSRMALVRRETRPSGGTGSEIRTYSCGSGGTEMSDHMIDPTIALLLHLQKA